MSEDLAIIEWFDVRDVSIGTQKAYLQAMQDFTDVIGKSPQELKNEAKAEIRAGIPRGDSAIKGYIIRFRKLLQDRKCADTTIKMRLAGIKSFYTAFDIDLPIQHKKGNRGRARPRNENMKIPTKTDLQEIIKLCDPLEKAVVLTGIASGLSANEIKDLKYFDFINGFDKENMVTTLDLRRGKTGIDFYTFLNPEATKAILNYLEFRTRTSKTNDPRRINQLKKQMITEDGYLFVLRNVSDDYLITWDEEERHLQNYHIIKIYRSLSERAKKNTPRGHWGLIRAHNMRKYFNSTLINNGCSPYQVDLWMGHELGESKGAYIVPDKEKQKKLYMQYMGFLIIEESQDPTTNPEYLKVIRENENLSRLTALSVLEYRDMKDELEWLKNGIDRATLELKTLPGYHTPQEELTLTQREKDILALKRRSRGPLAELADTIHKLK